MTSSAANGGSAGAHLEVGSVVAGDEGTVALREHHDLLLDVLDLIFGLLQVDDLDGHDQLGALVDALEHFAERALADTLLLGEDELRVDFLKQQQQQPTISFRFGKQFDWLRPFRGRIGRRSTGAAHTPNDVVRR